ncbi:manganese resistance protein Mnr2p [[Candida] railenensis]|uniref:Manganese resistance protein Mnr2p n=1 Tax=[Candida] railenensis TaxID=45579 RepID=A0A9P0QQX1_9ASCO|nr:manganese resistance protein Mnr2p [[Candida] railenensis]
MGKRNAKHKTSKKKSMSINRYGESDAVSESSNVPIESDADYENDIQLEAERRGRTPYSSRRTPSNLTADGRPQLTNHNLNSLSNPSSPRHYREFRESNNGTDYYPFDTRNHGSFALDMERFRMEQNQLAGEQRANDGDYIYDSSFGGSEASSDHSSSLSSLDDLGYYDEDDLFETISQDGQWPDLKLLEDFVKEETEKHQNKYLSEHRRISEDEHVTFHRIDDTVSPTHELRSINDEEDQSYESDDRSPLLVNRKVNEIESIDSFRKQKIPSYSQWNNNARDKKSILNNYGSNKDRVPPLQRKVSASQSPARLKATIDPELNRFSYFRQNLDKTIHSPTISGLLIEEPELMTNKLKADELVGGGSKTASRNVSRAASRPPPSNRRALEELFRPSYYSRDPLQGTALATGTNTPRPNNSKDVSEAPASSTNSLRKMSNGEQQNSSNLHPPPSTSQTAPVATGSNPSINVANASNGGNGKIGSPSVSTGSKFISPMTPIHEPSAPEEDAESLGFEKEETYPFWLDILDPTIDELKILSKTFGIHPLTTEDIFLRETREKVETFKSYYFICFRSFDVIHERRKQKAKENDKLMSKLKEAYERDEESVFGKIWRKFFNKKDDKRYSLSAEHKWGVDNSSVRSRGKKSNEEISPLNMYMVVFRDAVLTFHFSATPHPINVRRRIRGNDSLVSSDWICYALLDNIIDGFAPMIESIEVEVNSIEDSILKIHGGDTDSEEDTDDDESTNQEFIERKSLRRNNNSNNIFFRRKRTQSTVDADGVGGRLFGNSGSNYQGSRVGGRRSSRATTSSTSSSSNSFKIIGWKRKGDMLRRIGECRKRVMSLIRLLGSKPGVIKGFGIRTMEDDRRGGLKLGPGYLSDVQDHVLTMVQALKHCEKLSARFHKNYLAQLNIDMTQVSNDTNDVLGKITILGTIVLPINVVTGLWGMNCIVPGQDSPGLTWFWSIVACMFVFSLIAYNFAKRVTGL